MLNIGEKIAGCRIEEIVGIGAMGCVYKAFNENSQKFVALKILNPSLAKNNHFVERFFLEAHATNTIESPHIVNVLSVGEENGLYYIQMEFIDGGSLRQKLQELKIIPLKLALDYLYQISSGLLVAHANHIIHRDIKPDNILITSDNIVKIADFGLAKLLYEHSHMTITGEIIGTPDYLSPEQCEGKESDERSDIYALGVTFYQMISGTLPFQGENPLLIALARLHSEPRPLHETIYNIPTNIEALCFKMLEQSREKRFSNMQEILQDIESIMHKNNWIPTCQFYDHSKYFIKQLIEKEKILNSEKNQEVFPSMVVLEDNLKQSLTYISLEKTPKYSFIHKKIFWVILFILLIIISCIFIIPYRQLWNHRTQKPIMAISTEVDSLKLHKILNLQEEIPLQTLGEWSIDNDTLNNKTTSAMIAWQINMENYAWNCYYFLKPNRMMKKNFIAPMHTGLSILIHTGQEIMRWSFPPHFKMQYLQIEIQQNQIQVKINNKNIPGKIEHPVLKNHPILSKLSFPILELHLENVFFSTSINPNN